MLRELQLLAEDLRQLVERDVDLEGVLARALAGLACPSPGCTVPGDERLPGSPSPWPTPPCCLSPYLKCGMSICGRGMRDDVLALLADHLALRDVLAQVLLDLPADDLLEARVVLVDLQRHWVDSLAATP